MKVLKPNRTSKTEKSSWWNKNWIDKYTRVEIAEERISQLEERSWKKKPQNVSYRDEEIKNIKEKLKDSAIPWERRISKRIYRRRKLR